MNELSTVLLVVGLAVVAIGVVVIALDTRKRRHWQRFNLW